MLMIFLKKEKGFALFYASILILAIVLAAVISISTLTYNQQKIFQDIVKSSQAYYAAEAGLEDALLRLENEMNISDSYSFNVGNAFVDNTIVDEIEGLKTITGQGNYSDRIRKISVVYSISADEISFYYGVQVGDGGMEMGSGSLIKGNIYSNGSVVGKGIIEGTIIVANNGNRIEELDISQDAKAYSCKDCEIEGNLTYVTGGTLDDCDVDGSIVEQAEEIQPKSFPIPQSKIDEWKQNAEAGGVVQGYTLETFQWQSLGPKKVEGNMLMKNMSILTLTGTVWVTGNMDLKNLSMIQLGPGYGGKSGVIIVDGLITVENGTWLRGSGVEGSYIMLLSTNNSLEYNDPAIGIGNVSVGDGMFYASNGLASLYNNVAVKEVTAYKVILGNNVEIDYESGLSDAIFSSGPGASWQATNWKEIE